MRSPERGAGARIPFARYMDRCLYDEDFGYYAAGCVRFGLDGHFSTYAERLSPVFGAMVARAVAESLHALRARIPEGVPLTMLELGAGDGDLARDVLDEMLRRRNEDGWGFVDRLTYVIGEKSEALRERQLARAPEHVAAGRLVVHPVDALDLFWEGPFHGVVFANELVDAFPCEHLILTSRLGEAPPAAVRRVMVWGETVAGTLDDEGAFWRAVARGEPMRVHADAVPWSEAWPDGVPAGLMDYLDHVRPLVDDLATCELLPSSLCWAPGTRPFIDRLSEILDGPDRTGIALLVDYGGTSRHVLDPRSRAPHLRAYAGEEAVGPLDAPARVDLTWDVDFTDVGRLAAARGLSVLHFGPQAGLEGRERSLDTRGTRGAFVAALERQGYAAAEAEQEADDLVASFRESRGFHLLALGPDGVALREGAFGRSAPVDAMPTVAREVDVVALEAAVASLGLQGASGWLLPCCDVRGSCGDYDAAGSALEVESLLRRREWLRDPGEI